MIYKTIKGMRVPALGFGTSGLLDDVGVRSVLTALEAGYRHIDTAARYNNEAAVGTALRQSGISRDELFVTTKVWPTDYAPDAVRRSVAESLERLQLDSVDLLLVHWPNKDLTLQEILPTFVEQKEKGRARAVGVSNFSRAMLREATEELGVDLLCDQVEFHPFLSQKTLLEFLRSKGMMLTAYLPIARGAVFDSPQLQMLGEQYGKSAAQITLRWLLQQDNVVAIPRSSKTEHIRANADIFDFELTDDDMALIGGLASGKRYVNPDMSPEWDID